MKNLAGILMVLFFLVTPIFVQGEDEVKIYDDNWELKGRAKDGKIYDDKWKLKGHIKDGNIYDDKWRKKGSYEKTGKKGVK